MSKIDEMIKQIRDVRVYNPPHSDVGLDNECKLSELIDKMEQLRPYVELGEKVAMNAEINDGIVDVLNFPLNMDLITIGLIQQIKEQQP